MSDSDQGGQDPAWLPGSRRPTGPRSDVPRRKAARAPVPRPDSRRSTDSGRKKRGRGRKSSATRSAADLERELAALCNSHERLQAELEAKEVELEGLRSASRATPTGQKQHTSDSVGTPAQLLGALAPPSDEHEHLITPPQNFSIHQPLHLSQAPPSEEEQPLLLKAPAPAAAAGIPEDEGLPMAFSPFAGVTSPQDSLFSPTAADNGQHRTAFSDWRPRDSGTFAEWGVLEAGEGHEGGDLVHMLTEQPLGERSGWLAPD